MAKKAAKKPKGKSPAAKTGKEKSAVVKRPVESKRIKLQAFKDSSPEQQPEIKEIRLKTEKDFIAFYKNIDNIDYQKANIVDLTSISVSLKLEGADFDSSLTGKAIEVLNEYQTKIYRAYKLQKYGQSSKKQLTTEEQHLFEIKVTIQPGCTEALVEFVKAAAAEGMKGMDGSQIQNTILGVAAIAASAFVIKGVASPVIREIFQTKRKEIESKVAIEEARLKIESEKVSAEQNLQFLRSVESISNNAIDAVRSVSEKMVDVTADKIKIDNKVVKKADIALIPASLAPEVIKEKVDRQYTVEGMFRVLDLNYEGDVTLMKAQHIESGTVYNDISLQNDWLTKKNMQVIENAQSREPVFFRIMVHELNKKVSSAIDVDSIDPERKA
jgi:hypothetical protein